MHRPAVGVDLVVGLVEPRAGRQAAHQRVAHGGVDIDELEGELGGLAQDVLDAVGVVDAGKLDQDALGALALDGRLAGAGLVDAPAHDLERLADRGIADRGQRRLVEGERDGAGLLVAGDQQVAVDVAQQLARGLLIGRRVAQGQPDRLAGDAQAGIADLGAAQGRPHLVLERFQALAHDHLDLDLEQQVRAAPEIEAKADLLVGQPAGQRRGLVLAQQVGPGEEQAEPTDPEDQVDLPALEVKHFQRVRLGAYLHTHVVAISIMFVASRIYLVFSDL